MSADQGAFAMPARSPLSQAAAYLTQVWAVSDAEITKLRHDPMDLAEQ